MCKLRLTNPSFYNNLLLFLVANLAFKPTKSFLPKFDYLEAEYRPKSISFRRLFIANLPLHHLSQNSYILNHLWIFIHEFKLLAVFPYFCVILDTKLLKKELL